MQTAVVANKQSGVISEAIAVLFFVFTLGVGIIDLFWRNAITLDKKITLKTTAKEIVMQFGKKGFELKSDLIKSLE